MTRGPSHFGSIATRWKLVGPPLRPSDADRAAYRQLVPGAPRRVLVLGVTPELHDLGWPANCVVEALDASREMAEAVWPGSPETVTLGSWTAPPESITTFDCIMCDGGVGLLAPGDQSRLLEAVARMLAPGGRFLARLFAPQGKTGTLEDIETDLTAGRVPTLDALKLRVWGALQTNAEMGVRPADVVAAIERMVGDPRVLASRLGWSTEHLGMLDVHRTSTARYHLVSADELARVAAERTDLEHVATVLPEHAFGASCPIVALERRAVR